MTPPTTRGDGAVLPEPACVVCLGAGERYAHDNMVEVQLQKPVGVSFPAGTEFYTADQMEAYAAMRNTEALAQSISTNTGRG